VAVATSKSCLQKTSNLSFPPLSISISHSIAFSHATDMNFHIDSRRRPALSAHEVFPVQFCGRCFMASCHSNSNSISSWEWDWDSEWEWEWESELVLLGFFGFIFYFWTTHTQVDFLISFRPSTPRSTKQI